MLIVDKTNKMLRKSEIKRELFLFVLVAIYIPPNKMQY